MIVRARSLPRLGLRALGVAGWGWYRMRLLRRGLHMLQLESYQTGRFVGWWLERPTRVTPARQLAANLAGVGLAAAAGRRSGSGSLASEAGCAALGIWLACSTRFPEAKKPLVMTARAKRLVAGEMLLTVLAGWLGRRRPELTMAAGATVAPIQVAAANLALWPIEEALRRYYLNDAAARLRRLAPTVVAVAGSYGKTSTKEFLATILSAHYSVLRPPGSHNTPMGIARVIREQLEPGHEVFVAELGDWVPGDIDLLCRLLRPSVGVLTTIGPEHLERFKTMDRIEQSKFELLEALPAAGWAVVGQDDEISRRLADRTPAARVLRYGCSSAEAQVRARDVRTTREGLRFVVEADGHGEVELSVGVLGRHNVSNLLAAVGGALALGMTLPEIAAAAARIRPVQHRLQPIQGPSGILVIDDAFNSNPSGAAAALEVLSELEANRRILVTPGMVELGEREHEENRRLGQRAAAVCDEVLVVGRERAEPLVAGLREGGLPAERLHVVGSLTEARTRLETLVRPGDVVLFENDLPDTYADLDGRTNGHVTAPSATAEAAETGPREYLEIGGMRLAYWSAGQASGMPVVVLHGWGASADAVSSIQQPLAERHRVIAFDLPGFGRSDPPPTAWGSDEYAALIRRALGRLGVERAHFIGHSLGGKIAIVLASRRPELVERLVLVDSAGIRPERSPAYRARVAAYKLARRLLGDGPGGEWLKSRFGSADYRQAGALRPTLVKLVNEDVRPLLPRVQAPTVIIWGDRDEETPLRDARIMERGIPDAGLVVFPGAGHFAYADDPGRFSAIVGHFLGAAEHAAA